MEYLYKYPQQEFPYEDIKRENSRRSKDEPEYEILDTGIFDNNEYFDVSVTYAKEDSQDIFIKINIHNRYTKSADITVCLPYGFTIARATRTLQKNQSLLIIIKQRKSHASTIGNLLFIFSANQGYLLYRE